MATNNPKYPVPKHISKEAQEMLSVPIPKAPPFTFSTLKEWNTLREQTSQAFAPIYKSLVRKFAVQISKIEIAKKTVYQILPNDVDSIVPNKVILLIHGGGYTMMNKEMTPLEGLGVSGQGKYRVLAVDYRIPPEFPFPAGLNDTTAVYKKLLKSYDSKDIALMGGSAGGGLTIATALSIRDQGLPLPAAIVVNTPWSDLTKTGDSYYTNEYVDPTLPTYDGMVEASAVIYAGEHDLKNPLISPVYADFNSEFPPTFLSTGTRDLFLSNTVRLHRKMCRAHVSTELHVFEAMGHGLAILVPEEGQELLNATLLFLKKHLI